ncbi:MAG: FecR domain-containing protein [Bacteroidota bacterium]
MEEQNYQLIIAYFEKTIDDHGLNRLQEWIEEQPENLEHFAETIQILEASRLYLDRKHNTVKSWSAISAHVHGPEQVKQPVKQKLKLSWIGRAAVLLILSLITFAGYRHFFKAGPTAESFTEIRNPDGQHSRIVLPDGSVVHLAGGSHIKYAKTLTGQNRMVHLDGEAFFEVRHQIERPFIVSSGEITTVVLGTSFNVKAFSSEKKVAVTVKTGKVGVMNSVKGKNQLIRYLLPDEQIEINTDSGLYTFNAANAADEAAWIDNGFVFYNTPLKEIITTLEHHYGGKIEFTDPDMGKIRLTVKFKNKPLKQVSQELSMLSGLAFTQKGDHIFITSNHQKGGRIMK